MRYLKGLRVDYDCGEGEVSLPHEFASFNGLLRMDVIGDWMHDLNELYAEAKADFDLEMESYSDRPPKLTVT